MVSTNTRRLCQEFDPEKYAENVTSTHAVFTLVWRYWTKNVWGTAYPLLNDDQLYHVMCANMTWTSQHLGYMLVQMLPYRCKQQPMMLFCQHPSTQGHKETIVQFNRCIPLAPDQREPENSDSLTDHVVHLIVDESAHHTVYALCTRRYRHANLKTLDWLRSLIGGC